MSKEIECPWCGEVHTISDFFARDEWKCPRCGMVIVIPKATTDTRPGDSDMPLQAGSPATTNAAPSAPTQQRAANEPDWRNHKVENPNRAVAKFTGETLSHALGFLVWPSLYAGFLVVITTVNIDIASFIFREFGLRVTRLMVFGTFVVVSAPALVLLLRCIIAFARVLNVAPPEGRRRTPQGTFRVFLEAAKLGLYRRAYNCLTDNAQKPGEVKLPKDDYLQEMMPDVSIDSFKSFGRFWEGIGFSFRPEWSHLKFKSLGADAVRLTVPLHARWSSKSLEVNKEFPHCLFAARKSQERNEKFLWSFVAVRRGAFWFLTSAFFWPSGRKYSEQPYY